MKHCKQSDQVLRYVHTERWRLLKKKHLGRKKTVYFIDAKWSVDKLSWEKGMPHVLGLKQKDVCQRFRLLSWILVGFVAAISFAKNQERDRTTEAASKAQTIVATCAPCLQHTYWERLREGMKRHKNAAGNGCPLDWRDGKFSQLGFNIMAICF